MRVEAAMTAKKQTSSNPGAASIRESRVRSAPSVDGLLSMVDPTPASLDASHGMPTGRAVPASFGPAVGIVMGIDSQGRPLVAFAGLSIPKSGKAGTSKGRLAKGPAIKGAPETPNIPARSTVRVTASDTGREALIAFENGDLARPIITGLLQAPEELPARIELQAGKELVLKCGPASITLTKDGRIVIRGADVLTRSSGSNRIKGGSVHIN